MASVAAASDDHGQQHVTAHREDRAQQVVDHGSRPDDLDRQVVAQIASLQEDAGFGILGQHDHGGQRKRGGVAVEVE